MKEVLISSFDMEVGGVERSLISMLNNFNYDINNVDLMLYSHTGDFMSLLPDKHNLLEEISEYATYRKSIKQIFQEKKYLLALSRVLARVFSSNRGFKESGYYQMQLMWKYAMPFLPKFKKEYDVAISYLWPHYFVADKVKAKKKIAWIHTDYSIIETDIKEDLKIWNKFDYIFAVSEECRNAFLLKYPSLKEKLKVMENITSPEFINKMAEESMEDEIIKKEVIQIREKNTIRDEGIEEKVEDFNLISVARLSHAKGIDNAVKALKILHNRGLSNIKWYIVGYGGDEELIRTLISENKLEDSFILLGKKLNPYPYMKMADLYVQPSRYEGKAVTVTEAKILEKPVLITNYTTAKSQVEHEVDGYITELSIDGIADGIEVLYKNSELRKKLSNNCKVINYTNDYELKKLYKCFN